MPPFLGVLRGPFLECFHFPEVTGGDPSSGHQKGLTSSDTGDVTAQMNLKSNHIWPIEMCLIGCLRVPGDEEKLINKY